MTFDDAVLAARLALPPHAHPTGVTRLQLLGLDVGPPLPLRFVVQGELHLAVEGTFLHRTVLLPPTDDVGVTPAAAYLAFCHRSSTIEAIAVGDWLAHRGHIDGDELRALVRAQDWRDGASEVAWVMDHLVGDSRSMPESEVRAMVTFAGLPMPVSNAPIQLGDVVVHGDLWFPTYRCVLEYEGRQHQLDRAQYFADIDRYSLYRHHDVHYVQLTQELLGQPRALVRRVHRALAARGYTGPGPDFGPTWDSLFARLARVVPRRRRPRRAVS
ncbi:MAG TPA: hypothetical protein VH228_00820 [Nocardioides sp.]|nr:hypothetical protein [Nocardioides sp.]